MAVHDAQHGRGVVCLGVPIDHDVRGDDADADIPAEGGARRADAGICGQAVVESFEQASYLAAVRRPAWSAR